MSAQILKKNFLDVLKTAEGYSHAQIKRVFIEALCEHLEANGWDKHNKGNVWTDEELRLILMDAPTKENCLKHALAFHRSLGSIEQIYRWAMRPYQDIENTPTHSNNAFVMQIKRVSKELGWNA